MIWNLRLDELLTGDGDRNLIQEDEIDELEEV